MNKVLVLGAGGMAGHVVALTLRDHGYQVDTLSAHRPLDKDTILLDVTMTDALERVLSEGRFDVVVNCIGLLAKESEARKDLAAYLNGYLPHYLENYYRHSQARVIHLSTDCVFADDNGPYDEHAPHVGHGFYARSKSLGEIENEKDLTFRMSIIGPELDGHGTGLFSWFFRQSGQISGFDKVFWSGVTTIELAKAIVAAIEQNLSGIFHLAPREGITKHDLIKLFASKFNRSDIRVKRDSDMKLDRRLISTRTDFNHVVPTYDQMIQEMSQWISNHPELYPHYRSRETAKTDV